MPVFTVVTANTHDYQLSNVSADNCYLFIPLTYNVELLATNSFMYYCFDRLVCLTTKFFRFNWIYDVNVLYKFFKVKQRNCLKFKRKFLITNVIYQSRLKMGGRDGGKKKPLKAPKKQGRQYII